MLLVYISTSILSIARHSFIQLSELEQCTEKNLAKGLNTAAQDLAANHPDPVWILDVGTMTSHSHHTDRATSTGGAVAWLLKLHTQKQDDRGCLSPAVLPRDCHNITLYYKNYSKQEGQEMWLLWERRY